jgi:hypothetical protein
MYNPSLMLCIACGSLGLPAKHYKGSIALEALLLIASIFGAFLNLLLGGVLFIVFVVYCVWRLASKYEACGSCNAAQLIPANSPMAQQLINRTNPNS